ncbi:MAG: hypothetical protein UX30_C0002G0057 [Candidatus Saccharibacteria bacterium GW2011_GWA2_46_10]|nr:MAG: hypothetical protein UX30_C0002G0057 [Candidatus Saccharibacteria bacterium GW2011_GWA2_46_10]
MLQCNHRLKRKIEMTKAINYEGIAADEGVVAAHPELFRCRRLPRGIIGRLIENFRDHPVRDSAAGGVALAGVGFVAAGLTFRYRH